MRPDSRRLNWQRSKTLSLSPVEIKIELTPGAQEMLRGLQTFPDDMLAAIARAMKLENDYTVSHIHEEYESFPADEPPVDIGVRHITGQMKRGTRASPPVIIGERVNSAIGGYATNKGVNYAAVQELGAKIPPHDIFPKEAGALRFQIGERMVFASKVHHPGSTLPAREPIQRGIRDRMNDYSQSISAAIAEVWNKQK
jgi:hypothetical protein